MGKLKIKKSIPRRPLNGKGKKAKDKYEVSTTLLLKKASLKDS